MVNGASSSLQPTRGLPSSFCFQDQRRLAERQQTGQQQQLYQLRSIKSSIRRQEEKTKARQSERKAKQEAQKTQPRRLGRLKYESHPHACCQRSHQDAKVENLDVQRLFKHLLNTFDSALAQW